MLFLKLIFLLIANFFVEIYVVVLGLRGAATLKQRAESNSSLPEGYKFLQRGAIMHLCMPTGKKPETILI